VSEPAPVVEITDRRRTATVRLGRDEYCIRVWLDDPPQIRVSSTAYVAFIDELVTFFRNLAERPPAPDEEPRWVSSNDEELCVEAWLDEAGVVGLGVSLASDMWDPNWVVRVNLSVPVVDLSAIAAALERLATQ
jgi:hypothetical protein